MSRQSLDDLVAFLAVARTGSFTHAAPELGISQSALSHTIRALEARLGVRLLTRTTRSVAPTEAGERLLRTLGPRFEEIEAELAAVRELRDKPAGTIRITTAGHAAETILWPKLSKVLPEYPDIHVEISVDYGMTDIVAQRFDAGVRLGEQVEKDMIAVRIGPDMRMAVVATPSYFAKRPPPRTPQDLAQHDCINMRLPTHRELLLWEFDRDGQAVNVHVDGQWVFSSSSPMLRAALAGFGLAYLPEDMVLKHVAAGRLLRALEDWCEPFTGYHLYYASRRLSSRALAVVIEALRHRR
jgi:DNA-binding transcriptional LysR family regulator